MDLRLLVCLAERCGFGGGDQNSLILAKSSVDGASILRSLTPETEAFLNRHRLTSEGLSHVESLSVREGTLVEGEMVAVLGVGKWTVEEGRRVLSVTPDPREGLVITDKPAGRR